MVGDRGDRLRRPSFAGGLLLLLGCGLDLTTPGVPRATIDLVGLTLAGLALAHALRPEPAELAGRAPLADPSPDQWRLRWLGRLGFLGGGAAAARAAWPLWLDAGQWPAALPWWLAALACCLASSVLLDWRGGSRAEGEAHRAGASGLPLLGALAIAGLALYLRLDRLDQIPPGIFVDETNSALDALAILRGAPTSPFGTGWYETPAGYMYLLAAAIRALGPTLLALKALGVAFGVATVLGAYSLGRLLFGAPVGLLASLFMAFAFWPLNLSRWGWNETAPPAAHVWAAYFLLRGVRSRRATDYALGGLVLGLGMYSYLSIRLVLAAVAAYVAYRAVVERGFLRRSVGGLAVFAALWAVAFAPLAVTYARNPHTLLNRMSEVTIGRDVERAGGRLDPVLENARRHLLMFNVAGDRNPRHNVPGRPMLDPALGALLVAAVGRSLALARDHRRGLLLLWIPVVLLGGILSSLDEGPHAYRTLGVVPAVAILCAELLVRLGQRSAELLVGRGWRRLAAAGAPALAVAAVIAGSGWANYREYFVEFAGDPDVYAAFNPLETAVAREVAAAPDPGAYYLASRLYWFSPVQYAVAGAFTPTDDGRAQPPYRAFESLDDLPIAADGARDVRVLWGPESVGLAAPFRALYPHLTVEPVLDRSGGLLYERLTVPAGDLRSSRGLVARGVRSSGEAVHQLVVDPAAGLAGDFAAVEWGGSLYVPASGRRGVVAADGSPVLLDGRPADEPAFLAKGLHALAVTQSGAGARAGLRLLWAPGAGGPRQPVSATSLYATAPETSHGLRGTYYAGDRWSGEPLFRRVDPLILFNWSEAEPVPGPFSVSWQGQIEVGAAGRYVFLLEADDGGRLWLDGQVAGEGLRPDAVNYVEVGAELAAGRHPIRIDYYQRGGAKLVRLHWAPPGKPTGLVPAEVLWPDAN